MLTVSKRDGQATLLAPKPLTLCNPHSVDIGDRIRRARLEAGMTQRELALAVGVNHSSVAHWESHRKVPGGENIKKIAEVTLTDPASLLSDAPRDINGAMLVTDYRQRLLLQRFLALPKRAQDNLLELLGMTMDVGRNIDKKRHPSGSE